MSGRLPNAIDRRVASRLRLRRLEAGLTQTMLADALGISFQQLQKYEGATNRISAGALYQLAVPLDVPVQYFFDGLSRRDKKRGYAVSGICVSLSLATHGNCPGSKLNTYVKLSSTAFAFLRSSVSNPSVNQP